MLIYDQIASVCNTLASVDPFISLPLLSIRTQWQRYWLQSKNHVVKKGCLTTGPWQSSVVVVVRIGSKLEGSKIKSWRILRQERAGATTSSPTGSLQGEESKVEICQRRRNFKDLTAVTWISGNLKSVSGYLSPEEIIGCRRTIVWNLSLRNEEISKFSVDCKLKVRKILKILWSVDRQGRWSADCYLLSAGW